MEKDRERLSPDELPFQVDPDRWGQVSFAQKLAPDVYYIVAKQREDSLPTEYYVVQKDVPGGIISSQAQAYGQDSGELLFYDMDREESGAKLIEFELLRNHGSLGSPAGGEEDLYSTALFAAELFPEYFGRYPAPRKTTRGYMTRYLAIDNAVFFVDTEQSQWLFAVGHPRWQDLSPAAFALGEQLEEDRALNLENTGGCLFYPLELSPLPLFELWRNGFRYPGILEFMKGRENALLAALWRCAPDYVLSYNAGVQAGYGRGNLLGRLLRELGDDSVPESPPDPRDFITLPTNLDDASFFDFLDQSSGRHP